MAKREIPEINAGSMADIAFLLLIFFLVTTTMDRDKAYIRNIPKKVELITDPVPVQDRDILAIKANSRDQLMVRDEMMENPDDISERIIEFYTINEKLSAAETKAKLESGDKSYKGYNFPFYSRINLATIEKKIIEATKKAEEVEAMDGADPVLVDFMFAEVALWEKKKYALKLLGRSELPEISPQAHIRIEVQVRTGYNLFATIQSEIEEALFKLRDDASREIFGEGYSTIIAGLADDPKSVKDKARLDLLRLLYPDRIIEVTPKN